MLHFQDDHLTVSWEYSHSRRECFATLTDRNFSMLIKYLLDNYE